MRSAVSAFLFIVFYSVVMGQITIVKPLEGKIKNKDILVQAMGKKKLLVEQFTLCFRTLHTFQEPSMGMVLQVKLDLEPTLALEITDTAFAYFREAFAKNGITVEAIAPEVFKTNNDIKKAEKRGDQWLLNGVTSELDDKKTDTKYTVAQATGVNYSPVIRRTIIGTFDTIAASTAAYVQVIDFSNPATVNNKVKYAGSPIIPPGLMSDSIETVCGTGGFGFWNLKLKGGSVSFPDNSCIKWEGPAWLSGTKSMEEPNTQSWQLNREEFKKAVLALTRAQTDMYVAEYLKAITP